MKIAHLADIHIQDRRRAEYAEVFKKLYVSLADEHPDVIALVGDVFENKMRASPHNMEDVLHFLTELTKIAPVVMIAGNHDLNCLTPGALDLLTPLITEHKALQPPNLLYWRHSGVYLAHNIIWTVIAPDGQRPSDEEESAFADRNLPRICLFHEEVNGAKLPNHQLLTIGKLTPDSFDMAYDLALGGHIHLRQRFAPRAAYCGSLVQQNIGEPHYGHGYVVWEFEPSENFPYNTTLPTMRGIDIPNNNGFVRIEIADGQDKTQKPIPLEPMYWEVLCDDIKAASAFIDHYKSIFKMNPRAVRTSAHSDVHCQLEAAQVASNNAIAHSDIIRELLVDSPDIIDKVIALHESRWQANNDAAGGKFRVLKLEFDNMYAFGTMNAIDFTAMEGCISGVIAPNHTGKSSLVETLLFALYDDHPRAPTKRDVIHRGAKSCHMVLEFELDGKRGRIEKGLHVSQTAAGGSQYKFEYAGENRTKGGTAETLKEIELVIGNADSALASSFQLQGGEVGGFIALGTAGRKKLLSNVMSLGNFENIEKTIVKELTTATAKVKLLTSQRRVIDGDLEELIDEMIMLEDDLSDLQKLQLEQQSSITSTAIEFYPDSQRQLAGWQKLISAPPIVHAQHKTHQPRTNTVSITIANKSFEGFVIPDRDLIVQRLNEANKALDDVCAQIAANGDEYRQIANEPNCDVTPELVAAAKAELDKLLSSTPTGTSRSGPRPTEDLAKAEANAAIVVTDDDIKKATKNLLDAQSWEAAVVHLDLIKTKMSLCPQCAAGWITPDGGKALKEASDAHEFIFKQVKLRNNARSIIERANYWHIKDTEVAKQRYEALAADLKLKEYYSLNVKHKAATIALADAQRDLAAADNQINIAYAATEWWLNAERDIEDAKKVDEAKRKLNETTEAIKQKQRDILQLGKKIAKLESETEFENTRQAQLEEATETHRVLKAYRMVLKPNGGIGDKLLEQARITLENKINDGLVELGAKYRISITDDYDVLIINADGNLPASLGSGYQKFVLSLATRLAIWRLSVKARPDAFIIDEGFGVCDDEYLEAMAVALEALSSAPDGPKLVFVVSHVDSLKTRLERVLDISVTKTGSRISNTTVEAPLVDVDVDVKPKAIIPDPENIGKVWCLACKQSLSSSRVSQHLNSAKHAKNCT